jgi:predicted nucleic acid-binding protein
MMVVDSSVWLEVVADGPLAAACGPYLSDLAVVVTPTVVLFEVYRICNRRGEERTAMAAVGEMEHSHIAPADSTVAITAAELSIDHGLAAADAIVYATARLNGCDLVTADADFRGLPGVVLVETAG